jgi:L-ribulose-5-phosphate 4-epimerase
MPLSNWPTVKNKYTINIDIAIMEARTQLVLLHAELFRNNLVVSTSGNISIRIENTDLFLIKPSGVSYALLSVENMVLCDLNGKVIVGSLGADRKPSSDVAAHSFVYRNMSEIFGVVHTHSTYATAWAARAEPIPCVLTAIADEFGGEIPVGPFAAIGDDSIGIGIVETLAKHRSRAVLMQNHGVFTIGVDAQSALKCAIILEDVAKTVHISRQLGELVPIPKDVIEQLHKRYKIDYGQ